MGIELQNALKNTRAMSLQKETTIARLLGSKGKERVLLAAMVRVGYLVSMSPDPPTAKAAPKKATPIHPPKYLSIPLYASTRVISGQMFNICPEIAPKMP